MPGYMVAPTLRGVISVPGRTYRPGESFPAHLVSEELLSAGSVIVVGEPDPESALLQEQPAHKRKARK